MTIHTSIITSVLLALLLAGCAPQHTAVRFSACYGKSFNQLLESTDLKPLFNDIARELCTVPCVTDGEILSTEKPDKGLRCLPAKDKND